MSYKVKVESPRGTTRDALPQQPAQQPSGDDPASPSEELEAEENFSEDALRIRESVWRQMNCKTTTLTFTRTWVLCVYVLIAIVFIPIGILSRNLSESVAMQEFPPYSAEPNCTLRTVDNKGKAKAKPDADTDWGRECTLNYTVDKDFEPPIYFYYKLTNVFQNHRSYVKSRDEAQLSGENPGEHDNCDPLETYDNGSKVLLPCGLIAYSFFNDKYAVEHISANGTSKMCPPAKATCNGSELATNWSDATWYDEPNWSIEEIAWDSDLERFGATSLAPGLTNRGETQIWQGVTLPSTVDKDLIVWMRTATDSTFLKLHRIIKEQAFKKGDTLRVTIRNYFEVSSFDGEKAIVISTVSAFGGQNDFMGYAFLFTGGASGFVAVLFYVFLQDEGYAQA